MGDSLEDHLKYEHHKITPQWKHDCSDCIFKGRYRKYDLYVHNDSFIIRYGSYGPDYSSMPMEYISKLPIEDDLRKAYKWMKQGE